MTSIPARPHALSTQDSLSYLAQGGRDLQNAAGRTDDTDGRNDNAMVVGAKDNTNKPVVHVLNLAETIRVKFGHAAVIHQTHGWPPSNYLRWTRYNLTTVQKQTQLLRDRGIFRSRAASCFELKQLAAA